MERLNARPPARALDWVAAAAGAPVASVAALGACSSAVHRLDLADSRRVVLRRYVREEWLGREPDLAAREGAVLGMLAGRAGAPRLVACDPHGEHADAPAVLMAHLPGEPQWPEAYPEPFLRGLLEALASVHAIPVDRELRAYRPHNLHLRPRVPAWTSSRDTWERAFEVYRTPLPPARATVLLHRDFHQGNVLWSGGAVVGLVDWANASVGEPHADLGHCRMNLAMWSGQQAADRFLELSGTIGYDHRWDVVAAAGSLPDLRFRDLGQARRLERFVAAALRAMSVDRPDRPCKSPVTDSVTHPDKRHVSVSGNKG